MTSLVFEKPVVYSALPSDARELMDVLPQDLDFITPCVDELVSSAELISVRESLQIISAAMIATTNLPPTMKFSTEVSTLPLQPKRTLKPAPKLGKNYNHWHNDSKKAMGVSNWPTDFLVGEVDMDKAAELIGTVPDHVGRFAIMSFLNNFRGTPEDLGLTTFTPEPYDVYDISGTHKKQWNLSDEPLERRIIILEFLLH